MTQSEIYVALSRHKEEVLIIVPVGDAPAYFSSLENAISYPYVSDQKQIELALKFQGAARKIGKVTSLFNSKDQNSTLPKSIPIPVALTSAQSTLTK